MINATETPDTAPVEAPVPVQEGAAPDTPLSAPEEQLFTLTIFPLSGPAIPVQVTLRDNVQDVMQILCENRDLCYLTTYYFVYQGERVNDFADLASLPDLGEGSELHMAQGDYTPITARLHVHRVRDILRSVPQEPLSVLSSLSFQIEKESKATRPASSSSSTPTKKPNTNNNKKGNKKKGKKGNKKSSAPSASTTATPVATQASRGALAIGDLDGKCHLEQFFPPEDAVLACVHSIAYSGWNPPPGDRVAQGDLAYLVVRTLEKRTFHITSAVDGFFVNQSTDDLFQPAPADKLPRPHTLVALLEALSPAFAAGFRQVLDQYFARHPYEVIPVTLPVSPLPWLHSGAPHRLDLNRAETFLTGGDESAPVAGPSMEASRDWNAEYQACRELPRESPQEVILRERAMAKIANDFMACATQGAKAVVAGAVQAINPTEPFAAQLFIYNNIFFSLALNGRFLFEEPDGDMGPYKLVNNDLRGVQAVNSFEVGGLNTILTALVNYGPYRLVAQSIIPGILHQTGVQLIEYGSTDHGKTLHWNEDFHQAIQEIGRVLRIPEHQVQDENGTTVTLCGSAELKGVRGTDGRKYLLDLEKITVRDCNWPENWAVLRLELYDIYTDFLRHRHLLKYQQQYEEARTRALKRVTPHSPESKDDGKESKDKDNKEDEESKHLDEAALEAALEEELKDIPKFVPPMLNPNAYGLQHGTLVGEEEQVAQASKQVEEIGAFLVHSVIPTLVNKLVNNMAVPSDSVALVALFHDHGINMRYLGQVVTLMKEQKPYLRELMVREMIVRATKHILRRFYRPLALHQVAAATTHFLNCFVRGAFMQNLVALASSGPQESHIARQFDLEPEGLWRQIEAEVQSKFRYSLRRGEFRAAEYMLPTVRHLCQSVGVRLRARDYDMYSIQPWRQEDMMGLFPVVKGSTVTSTQGRTLVENAKALLVKGRIDIAFEFLTEALAVFHQVHGPMFPLTAWCFSHMASILNHVGDDAQALAHQSKALIILERTQGLDYYETAYGYRQLGLFYHQAKHHQLAFGFLKRSLYLSTLIGGRLHPDNANTLVNMAGILQENQQTTEALELYGRALEVFEYHFGPSHPSVASTHHAMAECHALVGDSRAALLSEKRNLEILEEYFGEKDPRVQEARTLVDTYTAQSQAKEDSRAQAIRATAQQTSSHAPPSDDNIGTLPIRDILKYINNRDQAQTRFRGASSLKSRK